MDAKLRMSPSSADRWSACPGSVTLSIGKWSKPEKYAAEGTVAHAILAECLTLMDTPQSYLGQVREQDGHSIEVTQEMVDGIAACMATIDEWASIRPGWEWLIETEVTSGRWPTRGFVDFGLISPDKTRCLILDFKFGAGVLVPIVGNPQVQTYGAVLLEQYPTLEEFHFVVVQPRARTGPTIKTWDTNADKIRTWAATMDEAAERIGEAHSVRTEPAKLLPLLAEGDHCRWCQAKPECPRLQGYAIEVAAIPKLEIRQWGAEECRQWLDRLDALEDWVSAVRGRAYQLLEDGEPIAGWKLVESLGNRKWARPVNEIVDVLRDKGFQKKALVEESIVSPAKVEKLKLPKSLSKDGLLELVASLTTRPVGGRKLTKDADPREAVEGNTVADDFAQAPVLGD